MSYDLDDDTNLYNDLDNNNIIYIELKRLQDNISSLELEIDQKEKKIKKMLEQNSILVCNISILFKTAQAEINRKDNYINNLRQLLTKNKISYQSIDYKANPNEQIENKSKISNSVDNRGSSHNKNRNYDSNKFNNKEKYDPREKDNRNNSRDKDYSQSKNSRSRSRNSRSRSSSRDRYGRSRSPRYRSRSK